MRFHSLVVVILGLLSAPALHAQDLASTCHASSSYDVTLDAGDVLFDRTAPAPLRIDIRHGELRTDGVEVRLNAEDRDRMALFEHDLRALAPQVRTVAKNGVDMAVRALRAEAAGMGLDADTRTELGRRLAAHAADLKQRIAASRSTHDWQGAAIEQYANQVAADVLPLLAADLGQQALNAALSGDLQTAASLRDRAASLATDLQPRLQQRMQALRPQIEALCPAVRRLADLQQGVRGSNRQPLGLLQIGR
ncbi:MAG: YggN family protein [Rhodanobacter sp.]|nr:YggN family protein [Rhodanobacter sp.]